MQNAKSKSNQSDVNAHALLYLIVHTIFLLLLVSNVNEKFSTTCNIAQCT